MSFTISQAIAEQQEREKNVQQSRYRYLSDRENRGAATHRERRELQRLRRQGVNLCSSAFPLA